MDNKEITTRDVLAMFGQKKRRQPTVCFPLDIDVSKQYELWGYFQEDSNYYNITDCYELEIPFPLVEDEFTDWYCPYIVKIKTRRSVSEGKKLLGFFLGNQLLKSKVLSTELFGYFTNNKIEFYVDTPIQVGDNLLSTNIVQCINEPYLLKMDIFSRNTGILESDIMLKKGAIIIGCGSVGSLVALELARAGVGRFFLIDMDIMGYHNICRHQCGVQDVGKFKTTAIKERILQINPTAEVHTENKMIQEIALDEFDQFCNEDCIMVGCADNREGDLYADAIIAKPYKMPFVSIGCWERAFAGEIFYCMPEGMPAYSDFVAALGDTSGRTTANTHLYMGEVGTFEPGISVDINFVTTIAVKLILDILNRDNEKYTQRLIKSLTQYTLICNTNNPKIGGEMAEIFSYPLQVTRSIKVEYANKK